MLNTTNNNENDKRGGDGGGDDGGGESTHSYSGGGCRTDGTSAKVNDVSSDEIAFHEHAIGDAAGADAVTAEPQEQRRRERRRKISSPANTTTIQNAVQAAERRVAAAEKVADLELAAMRAQIVCLQADRDTLQMDRRIL